MVGVATGFHLNQAEAHVIPLKWGELLPGWNENMKPYQLFLDRAGYPCCRTLKTACIIKMTYIQKSKSPFHKLISIMFNCPHSPFFMVFLKCGTPVLLLLFGHKPHQNCTTCCDSWELLMLLFCNFIFTISYKPKIMHGPVLGVYYLLPCFCGRYVPINSFCSAFIRYWHWWTGT